MNSTFKKVRASKEMYEVRRRVLDLKQQRREAREKLAGTIRGKVQCTCDTKTLPTVEEQYTAERNRENPAKVEKMPFAAPERHMPDTPARIVSDH